MGNTQMTIQGLAWCVSGVLGLTSVMALFITYGPGAESFAFKLLAIPGIGAIVAACLARRRGGLPSDHWVRHSRPLWWSMASVAMLVSLFAMTMVGQIA
jgi:hypothetical protein